MGPRGRGPCRGRGRRRDLVKPGDHIILSTIANCGRCRMCNIGFPTRCRLSIGNRSEPFTYKGQPCSNFAATSSLAEYTSSKSYRPSRSTTMCRSRRLSRRLRRDDWRRFRVERSQGAARRYCGGLRFGGVGLSAIQALVVAALAIIAIDTLPQRSVAREFGATHFVLGGDDVAAKIRAIVPYTDTADIGPFSAAASTGRSNAAGILRVAGSHRRARMGGTAVAVGVPAQGTEVPVPVNHIVHLDRRLIGVRYGESRPRRDIPLIMACTKTTGSSSTKWSRAHTHSPDGKTRFTICTRAPSPAVC